MSNSAKPSSASRFCFQEVVVQMSDEEIKSLNGILQRVSAGDLENLRLQRYLKQDNYTLVLV
jgi:hypothetical protein